MALSREEFENFGGAFSAEDYRPGSDPDQPHFFADITVDGHTVTFQGKNEEDILAQAEQVLISTGRIEREDEAESADEKVDTQPTVEEVLASHPSRQPDEEDDSSE